MFSLYPLVVLLIFGCKDDANKAAWTFHVFQVSYIYALAVFEDYLYATHSDPSKGSSSVELLQIHRFNITAESRTLASLGNARGLRVYHKLSQPRGKGHFLNRLTCASMYQFCMTHKLAHKMVFHWLIMISLSLFHFNYIYSQESCMWSGFIWKARWMLPYLPSEWQLQVKNLPLSYWLQSGLWWTVL